MTLFRCMAGRPRRVRAFWGCAAGGRLEALGATRVEWDYPQDADFIVLADPDGNLFCVINTRD